MKKFFGMLLSLLTSVALHIFFIVALDGTVLEKIVSFVN